MKQKIKRFSLMMVAICLLFLCSCTKTWTCEVSNKNVPEADPIVVSFTGTKEEMKDYEAKGTIKTADFDIVTKCK